MTGRGQRRTARADPGARRAQYHAATWGDRVPSCPASRVPYGGRVFGAEELETSWSTRRSTSGSPTAATRTASSGNWRTFLGVRHCAAGELGLVRQPAGVHGADLGDARGPARRARRRGHHRRRRLPDHRGADRPVRRGPRVRRRDAPTPSTWTSSAGGGRRAADARPSCSRTRSATPSTWRPCGRSATARPVAHRGQLRRARVAVPRAAHRRLRPHRHLELLSAAPHDHG